MTAKIEIKKGDRYGRLVIIKELKSKNGRRVRCLCDCGKKKNAYLGYLRSGATRSCGCIGKGKVAQPLEIGTKYGHLTILAPAGEKRTPSGSKVVLVQCRCDCGQTKDINLGNLRSGKSKSCGCKLMGQAIGKRIKTHGYSKHPLYQTYRNMLHRCYNPNNPQFKDYGGRGIIVCDKWKDNPGAFCEWGMKKGYKPGKDLDRRDNNDNYTPKNCRFVTHKRNMRNTRKTMMITINGETLPFMDAFEKYAKGDVTPGAVKGRLKGHWPIKKAFTAPLGTQHRSRKS